MKPKNKIRGQWSPRLIEMLVSPADRALSLSAHRVISRIEIELARHHGKDNGKLPVTKQNFIDYGIHHNAVAPAVREAEALGFIHVTEHGRGGNAEHRAPNLFFLTFANGAGSSTPPTHDWRKVKTVEEAMAIAKTARASKDPIKVSFSQRNAIILQRNISSLLPKNVSSPAIDQDGQTSPKTAARKNRNQARKPVQAPGPETGTENRIFRTRKPVHKGGFFSGPETGPTVYTSLAGTSSPIPPSLHDAVTPSGTDAVSARLPWSTPVLIEVVDKAEAMRIRQACGPDPQVSVDGTAKVEVANPALAAGNGHSPPAQDKARRKRRLSAADKRRCGGLVSECRKIIEGNSNHKATKIMRARIAEEFSPALVGLAFEYILGLAVDQL